MATKRAPKPPANAKRKRTQRARAPRGGTPSRLRLRIELEREDDGRWIADVPDLPGVMVYGSSKRGAVAAAEALALRVIADR